MSKRARGKKLQEFLAYPVQSSLAYKMYGAEEVFSGRDSLGEFEQNHVLPHLRCQSSKPVRTPSLKSKRGGSVDKMFANERGRVRRRAATNLFHLFNERSNSAGHRRFRLPDGRGAFQSPLRMRARECIPKRERGVPSKHLSLPPGRHLSSHRQASPLRRDWTSSFRTVQRSTATVVKNTATLCGSVLSVLNPPARGDRTNCFMCCGCWGHHQFNYAVHGISGPRETEPRGGTPGQASAPCGQHEGTLSRPPSRQNLGTAK
jgi:hypothetical protein